MMWMASCGETADRISASVNTGSMGKFYITPRRLWLDPRLKLPLPPTCATLSRVRRALVGTLIGLAAAALAALLDGLPFFQTIELKTYDWRIRQTADPAAARKDIALVRIDEASIRRLAPAVGRWPWPRLVHAEVLNYLNRAPARLIVYDVLFTERDIRSFVLNGEQVTGAESDAALVEATARAGNVVHVAEASTGAGAADAPAAAGSLADAQVRWPFRLGGIFETRPVLTLPFEELARASRAIGHNLCLLDPDGPVRRTVPFIEVGGVSIPSLAVAAAMLAAGVAPEVVRADRHTLALGRIEVPLVEQRVPSFYGERRQARRALIRFPGPVLSASGKETYLEYSFYDLFYAEQQLLAGEQPVVDPAVFRDKIVVIGTTAAGLYDLFTVPFAAGKMPGIQIHASVIDNLLSNRFLRPAPWWGTVLVLSVPALVVGVVALLAGLWPALGVALLTGGSLVAVTLALFAQGVWVRLAAPVLAVALASFGGTAYRYLVEGREKRRVKQLFSRYVSKDVFDLLMADPSRARLGGERREMTVLFSDIRGFTAFSERGQPEDVVRHLNEYFTRMVRVILEHRGTIDKFVGDMVMAIFGAPLEDPDHADHAVAAALAMRRELGRLNAEWASRGLPTFEMGIGINTGAMVAGNVGSDTIMSYTVIGDAVNLGARLESLTKDHDACIIISESTHARLKGRYHVSPLGSVTVKGRSRPVEIFQILERGGVEADC